MEIPILYDDDQILIINKPAGLIVHADGKTTEPTLVDWLIENYPSIKEVGEPLGLEGGIEIPRPGIVHRLDRETSGAIVVAKTQRSFLHLKHLFQNREVHKTYHAFLWGEVRDDRGIIDKPIGRSVSDFRQWSAGRGARGTLREAVTWFKVLARKDGFSFVEAQPKTGRTHQIRVHFKAINHPVVSDMLYAPKRGFALGFKRTALHSYMIQLLDQNGKEIAATAPYPDDFSHAASLFKPPST